MGLLSERVAIEEIFQIEIAIGIVVVIGQVGRVRREGLLCGAEDHAMQKSLTLMSS
jgi:hypothetical protein